MSGANSRVFLARCETYDPELLLEHIDRAFQEFSIYDKLKPGMTVVLKPNLIMRSRPEGAAITHPNLVAAVGRCVQKAGAKVLIAESPGGPYTPAIMRAHFKGCGYTDMAEAYGFSLYTDCKSQSVTLPDALQCKELSIVEPLIDPDFLIDLPKLKTHSMVGFSGAVKNMFGAVPGLQKPELHCRFPGREEFSQMLIDVCEFAKPDFSVFDGIWAMQGNGPTGGERRDVGAILASDDPFAADVCAATLVGIQPEEILMMRYGKERGLGPISMDEIDLIGDSLAELTVSDFKRAKASSTDFIDRLPKFLRPLAKRVATPYPKIVRTDCIGCGKCAESCPQHTIELKDGKAEIGYQNCIRCFCCHEMCPKHVIDIKRLGLFRF